MTTQHFDILIHAPRERVWHTMLQPTTYREWTAAFCEGSYYEGGWGPGERIRFLSPSGDGMVATIARNEPHAFVSIEHRGMITNGVEDTTSEAVRAWAPCYENYTFTDEAGGTRVKVEMDSFEGYEEMMAKTWPRALEALKALCEQPR